MAVTLRFCLHLLKELACISFKLEDTCVHAWRQAKLMVYNWLTQLGMSFAGLCFAFSHSTEPWPL